MVAQTVLWICNQARLRDAGITARVALLAVPSLLATLGLSVLLVFQQLQDAQVSDRIARLSSLTTEIGAVVHELQKERGTSNGVLSNAGGRFVAELEAQRSATTAELGDLEASMLAIRDAAGDMLAERLRVVRADLERLSETRTRIDRADIAVGDSFNYFSQLISHLLEVVVESGASVQDVAATRTFLAMFDLMQAKERAGQERGTGVQGFSAGVFSPEVFDRFRQLVHRQDEFLRTFEFYATEDQRAVLRATLANPLNDDLYRLRSVALNGGPAGRLDGVDAKVWFQAATRRIDLLREVEFRLSNDLEASARDAAETARTWLWTMLAGMAGLTGLIAFWSIGRSLARPIRSMTRSMTALAAGNVAVAVGGQERRDEVGAMAAAVEVFRANAVIRQEREAQIAHLLNHDTLTDLANRRAFQERIASAMDGVARGQSAAVFGVDLDDFKSVNDTLGHLAGDALLRAVAARMRTCVKDGDVLARLGGDEFAIVREGVAGPTSPPDPMTRAR